MEEAGQPQPIQINKKFSSNFSIKKRKYFSSILSSERKVEGLNFYIYRQEGKLRLSIFFAICRRCLFIRLISMKNACVPKIIQDVPFNGKCDSITGDEDQIPHLGTYHWSCCCCDYLNSSSMGCFVSRDKKEKLPVHINQFNK